MQEMRHTRRERLRSVSAMVLALAVVLGTSVAAYSQQRRTAKPAPLKPVAGSIFGIGYQKGYGSGFIQGVSDWHKSAPRDWQNSAGYLNRENLYDTRYRNSHEYSQGYELGYEMGHTDGYYGRRRNPAGPPTAFSV